MAQVTRSKDTSGDAGSTAQVAPARPRLATPQYRLSAFPKFRSRRIAGRPRPVQQTRRFNQAHRHHELFRRLP